jgi:diacylglycerol kinase
LAVANLIFMAMVMSFELINTIVENLCDLIDPTYNPKIKVIKDLGAGAVLVTALVWLLIIIFGIVKILIWFLVR